IDCGTFPSIHLEMWVFKALFGKHGLQSELMENFENTYMIYITVRMDTNGMVLYILGKEISRTFAMLLIVSLACNLRIKRNRARAWARGLQSPVWWSSRYFI
uniref:Uncharacterized protein n=1 Tax=Peromyscus maniculatus bairdii TaxID=230844 RepID=A0A8C8U989_PERMB